jgi:Protein of unknown function (DUF3592)
MEGSWSYGLGRPPREVPLLLRLRVLFGGFSNQFGWFFFGFGMIFVWAFTFNADLTSWYYFRGDVEKVPGQVTDSENTRLSVNGTPVNANHYRFTAADGTEYQSTSYATGRALKKGKTITIEYPQGNPAVSRIAGMRRKPGGLFGLIPLIFPLIGLIFMAVGIQKGIKGNRLLGRGEVATGKLISKEPTNTKINDRTVYKLTFEFEAGDGRTYQVQAKTHLPHKLEDEAEEPLVYDLMRPDYAVMLDNLPGRPRINDSGSFAASGWGAIRCLLIPVATLIGHGMYIYLKFLADP